MAAQKQCESTQAAISLPSLQVEPVSLGGVTLICDSLLGRQRPLVPVAFNINVFDSLHNMAHPGIMGHQEDPGGLLCLEWFAGGWGQVVPGLSTVC